ncbi:MAG: FAD-dependent oxidoreductase [Verrucomicrobiota bacterium]
MKTLAIIGTGISGLGAAYLLRERFAITLYEKNNYPGGHTNTITVEEAQRALPIDTGFMVYNEVTYPNLTRLFRELDVATKPTSMSFSVQHRQSGIEYNGTSLDLLFGQRSNLLRPRFWRMLHKISRFNAEAVAFLEDPRCATLTLRQFVEERSYGEDFLNLYLVPMSSAVWSTPPELMLDFPAATLIRFWHNHGFLGLHTQHPWRTVVDGARSYVSKIIALSDSKLCLGRKAAGITRSGTGGKVRVHDEGGSWAEYDKVLLACHADQSLEILEDPTPMESAMLQPFRYQPNSVVLHTDATVMPRTKRCWASWNYRVEQTADAHVVPTTHYWMNSLQGVSERQNYFVSLNASERIAPEKILRRIEYEHPLFNLEAVAMQRELPRLNRIGPDQTTYFSGAWFKYGFHEDGFTSAVEAAEAISGEALWT